MQKGMKNMFKLFKNLTKKDWSLIFISTILIIFQVYLDLKLPDYMTEITRLVKTDGSSIQDILLQGSYMLLCAGGSLVSAVIVGYLTSLVSATFSYNVREKIFQKVESFSMAEIKKFSTGSLITRTTNDITNVQMFLAMGLQMLIKAPITAVWAVFKILNKSWQWSAITGVAVLILLSVVIFLMITILPKFKIVQKLIDNINSLTRENLTGIRVIRAFNAENYQENKFESGNETLTNTQIFNQRAMSIMMPTMFLIMNLLTLGIYFVGATLINNSLLATKIDLFSNMVVFSSYAMQVIMAFLMLAIIFIMYPRASVSSDRLNEILLTDSTINDGQGNTLPQETGTIEFQNVSFKYPDSEEYVLQNISFKAPKGSTIAFIGSTGSGKSTLINLIPRFYDATSGTILVDGIDVKKYTLNDLHNLIGYVPQKAVMFNATVQENIAYGQTNHEKPDLKTVKEAIRLAQSTDFIEKMPEKYAANIAEGGTNLSGGQKQRLAIARAIARKPEIFIFDDSFSALDYKTDYLLRKAIKASKDQTTSLIVAQRIGTIMNADQIIVLDDGKCVGQGTHQELLKNCPVYQEIAYSQLTKEELTNE